MMRTRLIIFALACGALTSCSSIHDTSPSTYTPDSLCASVYQEMNPGTAGNIPSHRTVTATEHANLLKEYNRLGCTPESDNRYAFPNESLEINKDINEMPVASPTATSKKTL